jgi:hypothetical protein
MSGIRKEPLALPRGIAADQAVSLTTNTQGKSNGGDKKNLEAPCSYADGNHGGESDRLRRSNAN